MDKDRKMLLIHVKHVIQQIKQNVDHAMKMTI